MTVNEARNITIDTYIKSNPKLFSDTFKEIEKQAKLGRADVSLYHTTPTEQVQLCNVLRLLGYKVTLRNQILYISWDLISY